MNFKVVQNISGVVSSNSNAQYIWWVNSTWDAYMAISSDRSIINYDYNTSLSDDSIIRKPLCHLGKAVRFVTVLIKCKFHKIQGR